MACTRRIIKGTKGCGQLSSNENYFSDIWFIGLKNDEGKTNERVDCCRLVKTSNKGFDYLRSKS